MTTHPTDLITAIVEQALQIEDETDEFCPRVAARLGYIAGLREAARLLRGFATDKGDLYADAVESAADRLEKGTT